MVRTIFAEDGTAGIDLELTGVLPTVVNLTGPGTVRFGGTAPILFLITEVRGGTLELGKSSGATAVPTALGS